MKVEHRLILKFFLNELNEYIKNKMAEEYIEPQRKGTPKGMAIGLSRKKYKASLLVLSEKKLFEISKELGIKYGVLRKWRTEKAFKQQTQKFLLEFLKKS